MKTRLLNISLLVVLLVGCASVADDAVRLIGDDIVRFTTKYGDEVARTSQKYADDVGRQSQYSDEAVRYWDDVIRSSQSFDEGSLRLLYQSENLSPLQGDFVRWLTQDVGLASDESLLYLQGVCFVSGFVKKDNKYPDKFDAQAYLEKIAERHTIPISSIVDFTDSVFSFVKWMITRDEANSDQNAARILFDGLCLVSDIGGNQ